MSTIRLIYILLHVLEIWMLFVAGRKMSQTKTDKEYPLAELSQCILDSSNGSIINVI